MTLLPHRFAPGFTGSPLDRVDALRCDPDRVAAAFADPAARLLRMEALDPLLTDAFALDWGSLAEAPDGAELALLGLIDGAPRAVALVPVPHGAARSRTLWAALGRMPAAEAETYAVARSLIDWHSRHRFCANCGGPTTVARAGWLRRCDACRTEHFPRTDPVVIMLAQHGERALVGRQPGFPPGNYSALAGFLEVGESIEEAVARELLEEAGVRATTVRYVSSQPWPFASSLMIACVADVDGDALVIDRAELEDAIWVTRDEVRASFAGDPAVPFLLPPSYAIAHSLLAWWAAQG